MERREFFKSMTALTGFGLFGLGGVSMFAKNENVRMPVLFIGHGSPMNAIAHTDFTEHLVKLGKTLPRPKKILMVSAHWMTRGVEIQASQTPKTIHDFYGFPEKLFQMQYPAPGDPRFAENLKNNLTNYMATLDQEWGIDHGAWSVLHHMYPEADIPVVQFSLNQNFFGLRDHYTLALEFEKLRQEGVLIIGSGNIVHNLRALERPIDASPVAWAQEFDEMIKKAILNNDLTTLFGEDPRAHSLWKMAHPSIEHYLPLLYVLGAAKAGENVIFPYEGYEYGSLAMRSVLIG